ncbi:MAG: DUF177 domain-containing protein [Bacteroidetes bacterium]|nr:MAG: DUF177 domain-containing protein [Bacteroidota bacterium]
MKALKPFEIAFVGLSNGIHEYSFLLDDEFLSCFEKTELVRAKLNGTLLLHKKNNMLDLEFVIEGDLELDCDRCLEPFWHHMDMRKMLYVKFGDKHEEQSDEVIIIPSAESHIDVAQFFYEFIILGLPGKRVHPGGKLKQNNCDAKILNQLKQYLTDKDKITKEDSTREKPADSRWDALKDLKFN